jgi:hypothetical protein
LPCFLLYSFSVSSIISLFMSLFHIQASILRRL